MTTIAAVPAMFHPRSARGTRPGHLEITRRGRLALTTLVFLLVLTIACVLLLGLDLPAAIASWGSPDPVLVTVHPGDTLWSLAQQHAPSGMGTERYVQLIQEANDLPGTQITAGTQLELPAVTGR